MKHLLKCLLLFFLLNGLFTTVKAQDKYLKIERYKVYYGVAKQASQDLMVLRRFENEDKIYLLLVNPQTLETTIDEADLYEVKPMPLQGALLFFNNTPYQRALQKAGERSTMLQNAGIINGSATEKGISLTADLCPSHRPLDRRIFTAITTEFKTAEQPVPIALSITGAWMRQHPEDLEWLKQLQQNKEINITWVNHSYNHRVSPKAPLKKNFLLAPGTDINYEVLETEKAMLKNGLIPSVFFRFPGLVSDKKLVSRIINFGLIPIGADAWLAKGQQPQAGSFVLIHANGNEPVGVDDFLRLLQSKTGQLADKQWLLYDLHKSVANAFKN